MLTLLNMKLMMKMSTFVLIQVNLNVPNYSLPTAFRDKDEIVLFINQYFFQKPLKRLIIKVFRYFRVLKNWRIQSM